MSEEEKKQRARENAKRYYQKNKDKVLKRQKEYIKKRYREDEEFRNKIKEKNRNYGINNPEKVRETKRKSQYKYINKKRLSGELPLTQKMLIEQLQRENEELKERHYLIQGGRGNCKTLVLMLQKENEKYKCVLDEIREYINSNPNVFYDEYLIDVETLKNNECVDETVGEIKFISNLLQILDKATEQKW